MGTGPNNFELYLIPLGVTEAVLPPEFANAVRRFHKFSAGEPIWPKFYYLLPSFAPPPSVQRRSPLTHNGMIVADFRLRRATHRVNIGSGDSAIELGTVLWTHSPQHNDGELLPGEQAYLAFMKQAGGILRLHKFVSATSADAAWLTFLADYVWNHLRPKISGGCAIVGNLWEESLAALSRSVADDEKQLPKTLSKALPKKRGPKRKVFNEAEERLLGLYVKGWKSEFHTFHELAETAGKSWTATSAEKFIRRVRRQQERDEESRD